MLSRSVVSARAVPSSCKPRPVGTRARRTTVVQIFAKKSRQQELDDAYAEQLAYLEARRQKLATRGAPKQKAGQASQAPTPVAQAQTPKVKQAVKEPTIQVEVDSKKEKNGGGNPLGFLSSLFGKK